MSKHGIEEKYAPLRARKRPEVQNRTIESMVGQVTIRPWTARAGSATLYTGRLGYIVDTVLRTLWTKKGLHTWYNRGRGRARSCGQL